MTGAGRVWLAFAILLLASAAPIWSIVLPPLVDYPNHLARMHLLEQGGSRFYAVRWAPLPNLAEDLVVPLLGRVMPLPIAAKLFLTAAFGLLAGGAVWLNREATGAWRFFPLAAFLLLYNRALLWGFLNYLFGLGVALCGVALWLRLGTKATVVRLASAAVAALVCYFSHVEAFSIYALALAGTEAPEALAEARARRWKALGRRALTLLVPLLPPVVLFLALWRPGGAGMWSYAGFARKADLMFSVFDNYGRAFDVVCFAIFLGILAALAAMGRLRIERRLGAAVLVLVAAYLLLPSRIFSGSGADHRLPLALFLVLVAGGLPAARSGSTRVALALLAVLFAVRLAVVERLWLRSDAIYRADLTGLDLLPRDGRVGVAFPARAVNVVPIPEVHVATLAVLRRDDFVPTLFTYESQQPIAVRPAYRALAASAQPEDLWSAFVRTDAAARAALLPTVSQLDDIVFTDRSAFQLPPDPCLAPMSATPTFVVARVDHEACR